GVILVLDDPDTIRTKVKRAVTDTGREIVRDPERKPGISNLIEILAAVRDVSPQQVEAEFEGRGYGEFKQAVAEAVVEYLAPVRERYEELRPDEAGLERTLREGADKAREIASATMRQVRAAMGVGPTP